MDHDYYKNKLKDFRNAQELPGWYLGLSDYQERTISELCNDLRDDFEQGTSFRVEKSLMRLGLDPIISKKKIRTMVQLSRGNDLAFLYFILDGYYLSSRKNGEYTTNEKLLLAAMAKLDLLPTLRALDRILPPGVPDDSEMKHQQISGRQEQRQTRDFRTTVNISRSKKPGKFPYFQRQPRPKEIIVKYTSKPPKLVATFPFWNRDKPPNYGRETEPPWFAEYNLNPVARLVKSTVNEAVDKYFNNLDYIRQLESRARFSRRAADALKRALNPEEEAPTMCAYHKFSIGAVQLVKDEIAVKARDRCLELMDVTMPYRKIRQKRILAQLERDVDDCMKRYAMKLESTTVHTLAKADCVLCQEQRVDLPVAKPHERAGRALMGDNLHLEHTEAMNKSVGTRLTGGGLKKPAADELKIKELSPKELSAKSSTFQLSAKLEEMQNIKTWISDDLSDTSEDFKSEELSSNLDQSCDGKPLEQKEWSLSSDNTLLQEPRETKSAGSRLAGGYDPKSQTLSTRSAYSSEGKPLERKGWRFLSEKFHSNDLEGIKSLDSSITEKSEDFRSEELSSSIGQSSDEKPLGRKGWALISEKLQSKELEKIDLVGTRLDGILNEISEDLKSEDLLSNIEQSSEDKPLERKGWDILSEKCRSGQLKEIRSAGSRLVGGYDLKSQQTSSRTSNIEKFSEEKPSKKGWALLRSDRGRAIKTSSSRSSGGGPKKVAKSLKKSVQVPQADPSSQVNSQDENNFDDIICVGTRLTGGGIIKEPIDFDDKPKLCQTPNVDLYLLQEHDPSVCLPPRGKSQHRISFLLDDTKLKSLRRNRKESSVEVRFQGKQTKKTFFMAPDDHKPYQFKYKRIFKSGQEAPRDVKKVIAKALINALNVEDNETPAPPCMKSSSHTSEDDAEKPETEICGVRLTDSCASTDDTSEHNVRSHEDLRSDIVNSVVRCAKQMWVKSVGLKRAEDEAYEAAQRAREATETQIVEKEKLDPDNLTLMNRLLKDGLAELRKNQRYVLASLPDAHKLPVLREWIKRRYGKKYSEEEIEKSIQESLKVFELVTILQSRPPSADLLGMDQIPKSKETYAFCNQAKVLAAKVREQYYKKMNDMYMDHMVACWVAMGNYMCRGGPPRKTFYAYMSANTRDIMRNKVWNGEFRNIRRFRDMARENQKK